MKSLQMVCLAVGLAIGLVFAVSGSVSANSDISDIGRASDFGDLIVEDFFQKLCPDADKYKSVHKQCKEDFPKKMKLLDRQHINWHLSQVDTYQTEHTAAHYSQKYRYQDNYYQGNHTSAHSRWNRVFNRDHREIHNVLNGSYGPDFQLWHKQADEILGSHKSWHNHLAD